MFAYCGNNPANFSDPSGLLFRNAFKFLEEWLFGTGEKKEYDEESGLSRKFKRSKKMRSIVDEAYQQFTDTGKLHFDGTCEFTSSDSLDLYLTAQNVSYTIDFTTEAHMEKRLYGFLVIEVQSYYTYARVKISDTYDFDLKDWNGVGNIMNNIACLSQGIFGIGTDYDWSAEYIVIYREDGKI